MASSILGNHQETCRCCFKVLSKRQNCVKINKTIETNYFLLTQVELKASLNYSDRMCVNCSAELDKFVKFRSDTVKKQLQLYKLHPDVFKCELDVLEINIKEENEIKDEGDDDDDYFNDNSELLRDSLFDFQEPNEESVEDKLKIERSQLGKQKRKQLCPDCGKYVTEVKRHWRRTHSKVRSLVVPSKLPFKLPF